MATTAPAGRSRATLFGAAAAVVVVLVVAIVVTVLLTRDDSSDVTVPPLTQAERHGGVLRVTYADRSLPDEPTATTVGGTRVALFLDSVSGSSSGPEAALRVAVGAAPPTAVTLTTGQTQSVKGVDVTLVAAYDTGDPSTETADVTVAIP